MKRDDDLVQALARRWGSASLADDVASRAARPLRGQGGEWDPPSGVTPRADVLTLSIGIPDPASVPRAAMSAALAEVLARPGDLALRYDLNAGYAPLREHLAERYSRERGLAVGADWFQICNGSAGAIDLVGRALIDPGDVIFTEAPSYLGTLRNFRALRADVRALPMDGEGLCVDALAEAVQRCRGEGARVKLVYTIATFQNPTGRTLSLARRRALLALAAREGFLVLDDDAYGDLYYGERPDVPALSGLAGGHGVITVGSFSKVLATGLRVGWVHARPELIELLQRMRFDMGQSQPIVHMIERLAQSGVLAEHAARVRGVYRAKLERLAAALERHAAPHVVFSRPGGGFYLWPELRQGLSAEAVWRTAYQEGLSVNPGFAFFPERVDPGGEHLRVVFSWTELDRLDEAARRLGRACERVAAGDAA